MSLIRIVLLISSTVGLLALGALGFAGKPTAAIENETSDAPVLARRDILRTPPTIGPALNFAHRGASAYQAEHTLAAYRAALTQGADFLELDVHGSRDGKLVVVHDANLKRTAGADQAVRDLDLAEIRAIAPEIQTLEQVFAAFPGVPINIEIKQREPSIAAELARLIQSHKRESQVIVSSGSNAAIDEFRAASAGRVATGAALGEVLGVYGNYLIGRNLEHPLPFDALQIPYWTLAGIDLTTPEFIAYAHAQNLAVHFWTVDDPHEMERLIKSGADGIMTNRPDVLRDVLRRISIPEQP